MLWTRKAPTLLRTLHQCPRSPAALQAPHEGLKDGAEKLLLPKWVFWSRDGGQQGVFLGMGLTVGHQVCSRLGYLERRTKNNRMFRRGIGRSIHGFHQSRPRLQSPAARKDLGSTPRCTAHQLMWKTGGRSTSIGSVSRSAKKGVGDHDLSGLSPAVPGVGPGEWGP